MAGNGSCSRSSSEKFNTVYYPHGMPHTATLSFPTPLCTLRPPRRAGRPGVSLPKLTASEAEGGPLRSGQAASGAEYGSAVGDAALELTGQLRSRLVLVFCSTEGGADSFLCSALAATGTINGIQPSVKTTALKTPLGVFRVIL